MKFSKILFVLYVCSATFACSDQKIPSEPTHKTSGKPNEVKQALPIDSKEKAMLDEIERQNELCRGDPDQYKACDTRDALMRDAEKLNWCWGPIEEIGANKQWIRCSDDPNYIPKREWYSHDINHASCVKSMSPADRVRSFQEQGKLPQIHDKPNGVVEVEVEIGYSRSEVWTFYPSESICIGTLPRSKPIDSKYE